MNENTIASRTPNERKRRDRDGLHKRGGHWRGC